MTSLLVQSLPGTKYFVAVAEQYNYMLNEFDECLERC